MEPIALSNPNERPTDEIIFAHIGKTKPLWNSLFKHLDADHPDFTREWRYYRDVKGWLLKVTLKKKTIFWLSVIKGSFRTTFYFTDKAKELLLSSALSEDLKQQFTGGKSSGKIKGIIVVYSETQHLADATILIDIKLRMK